MDFCYQEWGIKNLTKLIKYLEEIKDDKYKIFNDKIVNTLSQTIGVQIPKLRIIAKSIIKGNYLSFLNTQMPDIYELHIIYVLVLSKVKDNNLAFDLFSKFLPCINNWAVCDTLCSEFKIVSSHKEFYLEVIKNLVSRDKEFYVRVGIVLLMKYYIETNLNEIFKIVNCITLDKYYVNMGIAWLLSMCYVISREDTLLFIKKSKLNKFIKMKTYQKIIESNQVSKEEKLKIKLLKNGLKD